jgi:hypothetical protein
MANAVINAVGDGSTDQTVVAAVAGMSIEVLQYTYSASADATVTWKSASTAISGPMPILASGGIANASAPAVFGGQIHPLFKTAVGEALKVGINAVSTLGGHLVYRTVLK